MLSSTLNMCDVHIQKTYDVVLTCVPSHMKEPPSLLMNLNHIGSLTGSASCTSPTHRHGSWGDGSFCEAFICTARLGSQWPISAREPSTNTSTSEDSGVRMTPNLNNMFPNLQMYVVSSLLQPAWVIITNNKVRFGTYAVRCRLKIITAKRGQKTWGPTLPEYGALHTFHARVRSTQRCHLKIL